jgi:hypothetical protein
MKKFKIELLIENSNRFNQIFLPFVAEFWKHLSDLKFDVYVGTEVQDLNSKKIIFGAHNNPEKWAANTNVDDIIVNLEPIYLVQWRQANCSYIDLLRNRRVYEYEKENLAFLPLNSVFMPIPPLFRTKNNNKIHDIIFVGSVHSYRQKRIQELRDHNIEVGIGFDIFGEELESLIASSKLLLSLIKDDHTHFSTYRFALCSGTSTLYFGDAGEWKNHPEISTLLGKTLFENSNDMMEAYHELIKDRDQMIYLLEIQNKLAAQYSKQFESFIREQVCADIMSPKRHLKNEQELVI